MASKRLVTMVIAMGIMDRSVNMVMGIMRKMGRVLFF